MRSTLRLEVVPSPATSDYSVRCLVDGEDIASSLGGIGLDPADFFGPPVAIAAGAPREALVSRCECGTPGCSDGFVEIARTTEAVVWRTEGQEIREFRFDPRQYDAELERATNDHSWEPRGRRAARLLAARAPHARLQAAGLSLRWAAEQLDGRFVMALRTVSGRQVQVDVPWDDDLERLLASAIARLERRAQRRPFQRLRRLFRRRPPPTEGS